MAEMSAEELAVRLLKCDVNHLIKSWAEGSDLEEHIIRYHIIRYLSSTTEEREAMLRTALATDSETGQTKEQLDEMGWPMTGEPEPYDDRQDR